MSQYLKMNRNSYLPPEAPNIEELYPRIYMALQASWGSSECRNYLSNLSIQDRDEDREGFEFQVLIEISRLVESHDNEFPCYKPEGHFFSNKCLAMA